MEAPGGTRLGSTVVVGLDFGTTFSGYAYCHKEDLAKIYMFYEWPEQASGGGQAYCKTQTSLFYAPDAQGKLQYKSYGWPASVEYHKAMSSAAKSSHNFDPLKVGHLVTLFKLTLAPCYDDSSQASNHRLPSGLTTATVITDFLREISKSIMRELKTRYGEQFTMREVQWCLTVPALWDDHAKQLMKSYAEEAGLVVSRYSPCASSDASPYPLQIVLEPEAAAVYCLSKTMKHLTIGEHDMFLTVDIGGGTVDIVVHKKVQSSTSNSQLEEVTRSTGGIGGGSYVDENFLQHLGKRIGCLPEFLKANPLMELSMRRWWGEIKSTFDGTTSATYLVPVKLYKAWAVYDHAKCQDEVEFTVPELRSIFDPEVERVIGYIAAPLAKVKENVKVIMVVGGFAASPYLMMRLREKFTVPGREVVSPPDPGSAVCQGAAITGTRPGDTIVSRVCRKTYGVSVMRSFEKGKKGKKGDRPALKVIDDVGDALCDNAFHAFVRNGDSIPADHSVQHEFSPWCKSLQEMEITVYSSNQRFVKYTTDKGVREELKFKVDISAGMHVDDRKVAVIMYFGGTSINWKAKGVNFEAEGAGQQDIDPLAFQEREAKDGPVQHHVNKRKRGIVYRYSTV